MSDSRSKYEDVKLLSAFSMFLEVLEEDELNYIAKEMEKNFSKEQLKELYNIIEGLEEEIEIEALTQEFVTDLKKLFN